MRKIKKMKIKLYKYIFGGLMGISDFLCFHYGINNINKSVIAKKLEKKNTFFINDLNYFSNEQVENLVKHICYEKYFNNLNISMNDYFKSSSLPFGTDNNPTHYDSDNKKLAIKMINLSELEDYEKNEMREEIENFSLEINLFETLFYKIFDPTDEMYNIDLYDFINYIQNQNIEIEIRLKNLAEMIKKINKSILANQEILNSRAYKYKKDSAELVNKHLNIIKTKIYNELEYYIRRLDNSEYQNILEDREPREFLLGKLLENNSKLEIFLKLEKKLVQMKYLSNVMDKWYSTPINFVSFYVYCEQKDIFRYTYKSNSKGVKLLRKLYNYNIGISIDKPSKRKNYKSKSKIEYFSLSQLL